MVKENVNFKLYLKTHNITGLKYLGKTIRDPFKYNGSGIRWKNHLKVHGDDVHTEILFSSEDEEEFNFVAIIVSFTLDVVNSEDFANIKHEEGDGGNTFEGRKHSQDTIEKMKTSASNRPPVSESTKLKISNSKMGKKRGKLGPFSEEHKENLSKSLKGKTPWNKGKKFKRKLNYAECVHCGMVGLDANIKRWHNDNCPTVKARDEYPYEEITCDWCGVVARKCVYFYKVHHNRCKNIGVQLPKQPSIHET